MHGDHFRPLSDSFDVVVVVIRIESNRGSRSLDPVPLLTYTREGGHTAHRWRLRTKHPRVVRDTHNSTHVSPVLSHGERLRLEATLGPYPSSALLSSW